MKSGNFNKGIYQREIKKLSAISGQQKAVLLISFIFLSLLSSIFIPAHAWAEGYIINYSFNNSGSMSGQSLDNTSPADPPDTFITSHPNILTNSTSANFSFISSLENSTFQCKLDSGNYTICGTSVNYTALQTGLNTFYVKATANGQTDASPATFIWTVDITPPNSSIGDLPFFIMDTKDKLNEYKLTGGASDNHSLSRVEVRIGKGTAIDRLPWTPVFGKTSWSYTWAILSDGNYTIQTRAIDAAGNIQEPPTSKTVNAYIRTPKEVTTNMDIHENRQLMVDGNQFTIQGVVYSPVPIGKEQTDIDHPHGDYFTSNDNNLFNRDFPKLKIMGANTVRLLKWNNIADHVEFLDEASRKGIYVIVGFDVDKTMNRQDIIDSFRDMVAINKSHPAILMWAIGNNLNSLNMYGDDPNLSSLIYDLAKTAHEEDPNHPVVTPLANENLTTIITNYNAYYNSLLASDSTAIDYLDIWGANVYRGITFGTLFDDYANTGSTKPLVILEFGIDAFDNINNVEYEMSGLINPLDNNTIHDPLYLQAEYTEALWSEIAGWADETMTVKYCPHCIGGAVMEYSDEWWRGSSSDDETCKTTDTPSSHSKCGGSIIYVPSENIPLDGFDRYSNYEWYGIMKYDENDHSKLIERDVYYMLQALWSPDLGDNGIMLITPNGDENWYANRSYEIIWKYSGEITNNTLKIELLKNGIAIPYMTIQGIPLNADGSGVNGSCGSLVSTKSNPDGSGSCKLILNGKLKYGTDYSIRVTRSNGTSTVSTDTSGIFKINKKLKLSKSYQNIYVLIGTPIYIEWEYTEDLAGRKVKIDLQKTNADGNFTLFPLADDIDIGNNIGNGYGSYTCNIPQGIAISDYYQVLLTLKDGLDSSNPAKVRDDSDPYFSITNAAITITSPNGGENWTSGYTNTIIWSYSGAAGDTVNIETLVDGTSTGTIATNVPIGINGTGSYAWAIPNSQAGSSNYQIKVTSNNNVSDTSNNEFTINQPAPSIRVTSPSSGVVWGGGSTQIITWTYSGDVGDTVNIEMLVNGISITIATNVPIGSNGIGSYIWNIPSDLDTSVPYKIRITSTTNTNIQDIIDDYFTISAAHSISGTISGCTGVTMTLSGAANVTLTTDGAYSFTGLPDASYTVTPSKTGAIFSPTNSPVTLSGSDVTGQNFTCTEVIYSISGTVTGAGTDVTVNLSGASSGSTTIDANGNYSFAGLANGNYTVTPSKIGCTFSPANTEVIVSGADITGQNFTFQPAVATLDAWNNIYSSSPNNTSATNLPVGSFAVGSGPNRLLLVSVVLEIGNNANPSISAAYGGTPLTQINITANAHKENVWMGYLTESQISSGPQTLTVSYSGASGNALGLHVKWASYTGVNQTTPIVSTGAWNNGNNSVSFNSALNYVNNGMTVVVAGNNGAPATGTLTAAPEFIAGTATTSDNHTSNVFTTAKHTADGSYASNTQVSWSGTTGGQSGLVVVSLKPSPAAYSISGTITDSGGTAMSGVTVNMTGDSSGSTTTNSEGKFSFSNIVNGNYTVTPSFAGYNFTPVDRSITINDANIIGQNFTGTVNPAIYSISGTITNSEGASMSGVTVNLTGALTATTTSGTNGAYTFDNLANGDYTVTPSFIGYGFISSTISVTINGAIVPDQDFTGSLLNGVTTLDAWNNIHSSSPNNTSGTITAGNFAVSNGAQRLLLVSVVMEIGLNENKSISATYGGTALTPINITTDFHKEIVWMGYLEDADIGSGSKALMITYSGGSSNVAGLHVKWASYTGVNQTSPIAGTGALNNGSNSVRFDSIINYVNNGMTVVVAGNAGMPATGTLTAAPAFTAGTATTSDGHTSNIFTTAKHTADGSYADSTQVSWNGSTGGQSGLVVVSLQP